MSGDDYYETCRVCGIEAEDEEEESEFVNGICGECVDDIEAMVETDVEEWDME